jgi:hypothetical protein
MKYVLLIEGKESGPYERDEVQAAVADGTIYATTLGRVEGARDWEPLDQLLPKTKADTSPAMLVAGGRKPRRKSAAFGQAPVSRAQGIAIITLMCIGLWFAFWIFSRPKHWNYRIMTPQAAVGALPASAGATPTVNTLEGQLAQWGQEGWELAGSLPSIGNAPPVLIFKRSR